jgi:hypothetical protein
VIEAVEAHVEAEEEDVVALREAHLEDAISVENLDTLPESVLTQKLQEETVEEEVEVEVVVTTISVEEVDILQENTPMKGPRTQVNDDKHTHTQHVIVN